MTSTIPPAVVSEIMESKSSPEAIAALLNAAEEKYSRLPRHLNAKRLYPYWKTCTICSQPFMAVNKEQFARNKTCGDACKKASIQAAKKGQRISIAQRKVTEVACAVCGKLKLIPNAWLKKVAKPTCSRECNGVLRGAEWATHARKGRSHWKASSEAGFLVRMTGESNPSWKGGITYRNRKGAYSNQKIKYVRCPVPFTSMARKDGYVMEHRLIAAQYMGRPLTRLESVHHMNHIATDNRPDNLMVFATNGEHKAFEHGMVIKALWCGLGLSVIVERSGAHGFQQVRLLPSVLA